MRSIVNRETMDMFSEELALACGELLLDKDPEAMGNGESVSIPGGGTEGYHVLRVCFLSLCLHHKHLLIESSGVH